MFSWEFACLTERAAFNYESLEIVTKNASGKTGLSQTA